MPYYSTASEVEGKPHVCQLVDAAHLLGMFRNDQGTDIRARAPN